MIHPVSLKAVQEQSTKPVPTFAAKMNHLDFMRMAETEALKSVCKRAQVGAVVVVSKPSSWTSWFLGRS